MIDVQAQTDKREIPINMVGIRELKYPIKVRQKEGGYHNTVASINVYVNLHSKFRGTHMSRFIEIIDRFFGEEMTIFTVPTILQELRDAQKSETSQIDIVFPYFIRKTAPVSGITGMVEYEGSFKGRLDGKLDFRYGISAPVTAVCPCSREISDFGAHNQRGNVKLEVRTSKGNLMWFEDMVEMIESCASAPVFSILKRPDEKFLTEQAYSNPVFVEDIVRNLTSRIMQKSEVEWFRVEAENFESIHNHNAVAIVEKELQKPI